jgi:hypothetical protein
MYLPSFVSSIYLTLMGGSIAARTVSLHKRMTDGHAGGSAHSFYGNTHRSQVFAHSYPLTDTRRFRAIVVDSTAIAKQTEEMS